MWIYYFTLPHNYLLNAAHVFVADQGYKQIGKNVVN